MWKVIEWLILQMQWVIAKKEWNGKDYVCICALEIRSESNMQCEMTTTHNNNK